MQAASCKPQDTSKKPLQGQSLKVKAQSKYKIQLQVTSGKPKVLHGCKQKAAMESFMGVLSVP